METIPKIPLYRNNTKNTRVQIRYPKYLCMEMIPKIPLYRNNTKNTCVQIRLPKYLCMEMIPKIALCGNNTQNTSVWKRYPKAPDNIPLVLSKTCPSCMMSMLFSRFNVMVALTTNTFSSLTDSTVRGVAM